MTREMIITELNKRGYNAYSQNTVKNGVQLEAIRISSGSNIAPVIYTEDIIKIAEEQHKTLEDIVSMIIGLYESTNAVDFDLNMLFDRDYILNNIFIGMQKVSTEHIEKKLCDGLEGIECYLYIRGKAVNDGYFSTKVSSKLLDKVNISELEAWEKAKENTDAETTIKSLIEVICNMMNVKYSADMEDDKALYVITNKSKVKGASAILNKKVLANFGKKHNTDRIVVLPSSIHEMIIIPYTEGIDINTYSEMVGEVNSSTVEPTERLTDRAYILTL